MMTQSLALAKKPHVVIATPGRLVDHLENTKGFSLRTLRYLVMDEADRILNMDFEAEVSVQNKVLIMLGHLAAQVKFCLDKLGFCSDIIFSTAF